MRIAIPLLLLGLGLTACGDKDDTAPPEGDTDTDTDTDSDTDADSDADADADTDADADADVDAVLTFDIGEGWEGTGLTLSHMVPGEDMDFSTTFYEVAVTGETVGIDPGDVPAEHLLEVEPGLTIAMYVPSLFADTDSDSAHDEGERYVGISTWWPVWIDGEPPTEYADLGLVAGWNALELDFESDGEFTVGDPMAIPLPASLWPNEEITIGGSYAGTQPTDTQRLTLISGVAMEGGDLSDLLYDDALADPWSITVKGDAPESHVIEQDEFGLTMAWEYPFTYLDNDGSLSPTDGDLPLNFACMGSEYVLLYWMQPATTVEQAFMYAYGWEPYGWTPGWFAASVDPRASEPMPVALDDSDLTTLELSAACNPWGGAP